MGSNFMSNQRKQIIINEITFWKQNKLLPEQYCDFLMTLYTEGQQLEEPAHQKAVLQRATTNKNHLWLLFATIVSALLLYSLFEFTTVSWLMPAIGAVVAIVFMVSAFLLVKKQRNMAAVLQVLAALLLFAVSIQVSQTFFPNDESMLYIFILMNCGLWLVSGFLLKAVYFILSGSIGLVFVIAHFFFTM